MNNVSEKTHFDISMGKVIGNIPDILQGNIKLIQDKENQNYILHVISDLSENTQLFDLRKKLRHAGFIHEIKWANRQYIENLNHIFNTTNNEKETDQTDRQNKILEIIKLAVERRTSDIHIRIENSFTQLFFRIDGTLIRINEYEDTVEGGKRLIQTLYNSMCDERSTSTFSYTEPADAKIREEFVQGLGLSTGRFASRPGSAGKVLVVIRLIARRKKSLMLCELGLTGQEEKIIRTVLAKPAGVIFSSGPTGHGKSTLSQCMAELYTAENPGMNLLTVEDPVESPISGTFQTPLIYGDRGDRELMSKAWAKAMSNLMRLDLDSIYIGEVRDSTSATGVVEAAQTGHSVITTIHTSHPIDIIQRLRRLGVDQDLLTDATLITCLIRLRLVKLLCPDCKIRYTDNRKNIDPLFTEVIDKYTSNESVYLQNTAGCRHCENTGIKGRTGVFEVIETDYEFMRLYDEKGKFAAWQHWRDQGGVTLCQNVIRLINGGHIDPIVAHRSICNLDRDEKFQ